MKRRILVLVVLAAVVWGAGAQGAGLIFRSDQEASRALARYVMAGKVPATNAFVYSGR